MPKLIPGDGPIPCRLMLIGERPGREEYRANRPFVGPAGQELWSRLTRTTGLARDDCYVTNLVKSVSLRAPSPEEIARDWPALLGELLRVKPNVIATIGYHAARALLPQFAHRSGSEFHGLPFRFIYGRLHTHEAIVVPIVHSAAALRQPALYQEQLTSDLTALGHVLDGRVQPVPSAIPNVTRISMRETLTRARHNDSLLGFDTEGELDRPWTTAAITLSADTETASLIETPLRMPFPSMALGNMNSERWHVTTHNALHDLKALASLRLTAPEHVDDTMVMAYLLGLPQGLKELCRRLLGWAMEDYADLIEPYEQANVSHALKVALANDGLPKRAAASIRKILTKPADRTMRQRWHDSTFASLLTLPPLPQWKDLPVEVREPYALRDAVAHHQIREALWPQVASQGLTRAYRLDLSVIPMLARSEMVGMACDGAVLTELSKRYEQEYAEVCHQINKLAGFEVNPRSGEQVSQYLFDELGLTPTRPTKSRKHFTTEDKYLKARRHEHQIVALILEARQLSKYKTTYTDRLPKLLQDGRYYPNWKYTRTTSGRLAEEIILLIPKHSARAKAIRDGFHATEGHVLVSVDLSQIELRVMAHLSRDPILLGVFERGEDMHAEVAHDLLGAPKGKENQDDSKHRLPAKTMNFGIINGMTEFGMLDQLHEAGQLQWDLAAVKQFRDDWFCRYAGVQRFWDSQIAQARRYGYVKDLFGRRRALSAMWSTSPAVVKEAERQCLFAIQATADGISKRWNARIWKQILQPRHAERAHYCEFWVRIHDDTTLEVDERIAQMTAEQMLDLVPDLLVIPTTAEVKIGRSWGSLHSPTKLGWPSQRARHTA